jgi:hypothetical protein
MVKAGLLWFDDDAQRAVVEEVRLVGDFGRAREA